LKQKDAEKEENISNTVQEILRKSQESPEAKLDPIYICKELDSALSDNCILVADGGDFVGTAAYVTR
jgi:acetolactate synthase-like protein